MCARMCGLHIVHLSLRICVLFPLQHLCISLSFYLALSVCVYVCV